MTPQQQKEQDIQDLKRFFRKAGRITLAALFCAATYGAAGLGVYSLWNGVTFTRSHAGRAEHTFKDGTHKTVVGRGFSLTNPFTVADTTKWELTSNTNYFRSGAKEQDKFHAVVSFTYVGPETFTNLDAVRHATQKAGDQALKDVFHENNWTSYAAVDPATQPQNTAKLCDALSRAVSASLEPGQAEHVTTSRCEVEVKVPFKGYTAKV